MGSEVAVFNAAKLPAHLRTKAELSETAKALMGNPGIKRISIRNGVWRLLDGGKEITQVEERYLDVVIIRAAPKVSRVFYLKAFDKDDVGAPDCWSNDGELPDASIKEPQHANCAKCPQNVAGSGKGESRACRFQQRVAVVTAGNLIQSLEDGSEPDVLQFTVPATSLFGKAEGEKRPLQEYARWLVAQKVSPEMLVTRMRFDTSDDAEAVKVWFKPMRWLEQDEFDLVEKMAASPEAERAIVMTVAQADNVKSKVDDEIGSGDRPARKAKAAEEEESAPPKTRTRKAKAKDEDEDAPAPARKAKAKDEDEDDAPAPARKAKAQDDDDEDDAPAPSRKAKAKATDDDEDDAPAPARKAKAKDEDEDEPPTKRASSKNTGPDEGTRKDAAALVDEWDD